MEAGGNIDQSLLPRQENDNNSQHIFSWEGIGDEMKKLGYIAGPMVAVTISQYLLQIISVMMVGHLDELALSSTAVAVSIANVSGFSILLGLACALETIGGQAYGAKQYKKLGSQTYTGIFCLMLVCIPLSILWIYMERVLIFLGQDPQISHEAGKYLTYLVPALIASAALQPLIRYFQMQSMILPLLVSSCFTICFHIPICWVLVYKTALRNCGGAVALGLSFWLNVVFLGSFMKYSPSCTKTRSNISMEIFRGIKEFFRLAIPSAVMICVEWWSYEMLVLLSGLLPNPQLETSVLSVCLNTTSMLYAIPFGLSAAVSTRVSNELGAGNPHGAKMSVVTVMVLAVMEMIILDTILFSSRHVFGYVFSNEMEVIDYVTEMAPLLCLFIIMDAVQGVLSGVARGCGWQQIGAYINIIAFYLFGFPVSGLLCFLLQFRAKGLWIGVIVGAGLQNIALATITSFTNWEAQAIKARQRLS
ncbi:transporter [Lithospermum erythrorhizon]|uniref:Protein DETOXIFICATION n=1 Tax=Lithospermum erythrorhizon TaxID=34254 RepID=A0AAV3P2N5_LITER